MELGKYTPGKLKLKKRVCLKDTKEKEKKKEPENSEEEEDLANLLTEAQINFLSTNMAYHKRTEENKESLSYSDQVRQYSEKLKKLPKHNDLEGD